MNTLGFDLVLTEDSYAEIIGICAEALQQTKAKALLLVGCDGSVIAKQGFVEDLDCDSLAALSAATYASTREIASLIGEQQFDTFYHQGRSNHVLMVRVGDYAILVVVFDGRTTAGMVRLYAQEAALHLSGVAVGPG
jgi:predicted regulator of Ras-like GTPase activity (Roadblock/LC7/MglB family)